MDNLKINKNTRDVITNYITQEESKKIIAKLELLKNKNVTVTNTGVVSSGKSSLFNALLDMKDDERFSVGAARTTVLKDIEKFSDNIELVDTPGIDVKEADDDVALNAVCASSIIVMVHNIKMGMLHKNEVDWIKKISMNFNSEEEKKDRFIFISSWMDERMGEASYQNTINETKRILFETIGTEVDFYSVSAKLYKKGISENKQKFIEMSNILDLKKGIIDKAELYLKKYGTTAVKKEIVNLCKGYKDRLDVICQNMKMENKEIEDRIQEKYQIQKREWDAHYRRYQDMFCQYENIITQLNEL